MTPRLKECKATHNRLTDIDLSELQIGERLTIYRGSPAFVTGPLAAGYAGEATVVEVQRRSAILRMPEYNGLRQGQGYGKEYRLRFRDGRIVRSNGEATMLYVHARDGRPTVTVYLTGKEYALVKDLLETEKDVSMLPTTQRLARAALDRMAYHERLRRAG